jgi:hypothetical protein
VRLVRLVLQGLQRMLVRLAQWMQLDTRRIDMHARQEQRRRPGVTHRAQS